MTCCRNRLFTFMYLKVAVSNISNMIFLPNNSFHNITFDTNNCQFSNQSNGYYKFFLPMKAIIESLVLLTFFFLTNVNIKILFLLLKISDKCNYRNSFFTCVCFFLYFQFPVQSLRDLTLLINVVLLRG